jgi:GTP-binding protein
MFMNMNRQTATGKISALRFTDVRFLTSVFSHKQLPEPELPEIAFAGRSNVGKSSLINRLIKRKNLVKTSARPGKTQSLNFFLVDDSLCLVDLPGYGYAKVPKKMKDSWQKLITGYLESRETLKCVIVIIDLRHSLKLSDRQLVDWLRSKNIPYLLVYTKMDKISGNERQKYAAALDAGFGVAKQERLLFSAKTGEGREKILQVLDSYFI